MNPEPPNDLFRFEDLVVRADEDFDKYYDHTHFADLASREDTHYWHLYRRHIVADQLRRLWSRPGGRFVEIGCGTGTVATYLNQTGFHVDYADVHREALEFARSRAQTRVPSPTHPLRFFRIDIATQELPAVYDGALLLDVLEHLPDDRQALERVRSQLERDPGEKVIIFTVPAFNFLWSPWDDINHHQRRYTLRSATELARAAGLEVVRATCFFFPLFFAAALVKSGRMAIRGVAPRSKPEGQVRPGDLVETKSHPIINSAVLKTLELERAWLQSHDLPVGTSILCAARVKR